MNTFLQDHVVAIVPCQDILILLQELRSPLGIVLVSIGLKGSSLAHRRAEAGAAHEVVTHTMTVRRDWTGGEELCVIQHVNEGHCVPGGVWHVRQRLQLLAAHPFIQEPKAPAPSILPVMAHDADDGLLHQRFVVGVREDSPQDCEVGPLVLHGKGQVNLQVLVWNVMRQDAPALRGQKGAGGAFADDGQRGHRLGTLQVQHVHNGGPPSWAKISIQLREPWHTSKVGAAFRYPTAGLWAHCAHGGPKCLHEGRLRQR
mmetsp:Transcript_97248/g.167596  ORF Transcript_97248/g.167596 Transcript_97248/m.167596 type:complete len:258 (+) Transcript_97248:1052-1825(+)